LRPENSYNDARNKHKDDKCAADEWRSVKKNSTSGILDTQTFRRRQHVSSARAKMALTVSDVSDSMQSEAK